MAYPLLSNQRLGLDVRDRVRYLVICYLGLREGSSELSR